MFSEIMTSISQHSYYAIFVLVFMQEVGVPSPIPNELVLLFSGYLAFLGILKFPFIILAAVSGDLLGGAILFGAFYFFGKKIMNKKPKWLPISENKMVNLSLKIEKLGRLGVYIGRLSPFIRGYVSVLCGLLRLPVQRYSFILLCTSAIWALSYVGLGYLIGPYWDLLTQSKSDLYMLFGLIPAVLLFLFIVSVSAKRIFFRTNQPLSE